VVTFGVPIDHGVLRVVPLLGDDDPACEYVTLDEALAAGAITITEVSEEGRIPDLRVRNTGSKPVLIIDGEELVGAKQNRVLNLTVLIGAYTETTIPVSCVEAGRWRHLSRHFVSSPHHVRIGPRGENGAGFRVDAHVGRASRGPGCRLGLNRAQVSAPAISFGDERNGGDVRAARTHDR
jgi:ARG/rhodanese/phosphatase superfamily protein